jgi:hypothetical protein
MKEHQRQTRHKQNNIEGNIAKLSDVAKMQVEMSEKARLIVKSEGSLKTKDAEFTSSHDQLKQAFANAIADVSMLRPIVAKHLASLGEDSSFETTSDIFKPAINYLLDMSHKFGINWQQSKK